MKRRLPSWFLVIGVLLLGSHVRAETETIDLKALAKKARPAVMLLVVSDANGKEIATGTGFLVSSDGKLITNHHVIEGGASAIAKAENGGLFPVEGVLADDPKNDLVLLKLKGKDLPFLPLGNSDKIEVGTRIAVIGSPLGLEGTLSEGIVSAVRELMGDQRLLQVTAAISPGSSGSPVMNAKGDVVGVASALLRGGQSLNFAVPVSSAQSLLAIGQKASTIQTFSESVTSNTVTVVNDPDYWASVKAETAKDYVEMLKHCQALVRRYPKDSLALLRLGIAYDKLHFTDEADKARQRATEIGQQAIDSCQQAVKLKPDDPKAWYDLAEAYGNALRSDDEIAAFQQAIKLRPDYSDAWWGLANAYHFSRRTDEAVAAFRRGIDLTPDVSTNGVWVSIGQCYGEVGRNDDAIAAYRQAIKLKPDDGQAWYYLGVSYEKAGRQDDAIGAYRRLVELAPDYAEAWYNLGMVYEKVGRQGEADDAFQRAKKLKPDLVK